MTQPPAEQKIYHILHVDRLASVRTADGFLWSDSVVARRSESGYHHWYERHQGTPSDSRNPMLNPDFMLETVFRSTFALVRSCCS